MPTKKVTTATLEGKKVPKFQAEVTPGEEIKSTDIKGSVVYFYPKDSTPGCTQEGEDFRDNYRKFKNQGFEIYGVSRDSLKSHEKFKAKYDFPFELISDPEEQMCQAFDVIKEKNMYGKKFMGIERSTFVIDGSGKVVKEWRKVKVPGHIDEVLGVVKGLK